MVNFNPIDKNYIVRWQSDLENTKESRLPVCDKPYHKIKENIYRDGRSSKKCETIHYIDGNFIGNRFKCDIIIRLRLRFLVDIFYLKYIYNCQITNRPTAFSNLMF